MRGCSAENGLRATRRSVVVGREPVGSVVGQPEVVHVEHVEVGKPRPEIRWQRSCRGHGICVARRRTLVGHLERVEADRVHGRCREREVGVEAHGSFANDSVVSCVRDVAPELAFRDERTEPRREGNLCGTWEPITPQQDQMALVERFTERSGLGGRTRLAVDLDPDRAMERTEFQGHSLLT